LWDTSRIFFGIGRLDYESKTRVIGFCKPKWSAAGNIKALAWILLILTVKT
jgi:hypothetical protein